MKRNREKDILELQGKIRRFRIYLERLLGINDGPVKEMIQELHKRVGKRMNDRRPYHCHPREENPGRPAKRVCKTK